MFYTQMSDTFSCTKCDHTADRKHDLKCHMKRHANTPATPNLPLKVAGRDPVPTIISPPANDHLFEQLEQQDIQSMFDQNTHNVVFDRHKCPQQM